MQTKNETALLNPGQEKRPLHSLASQEMDINDWLTNSLAKYIKKMNGRGKGNLYDLVIQGVEKPLIGIVLEATQGNQAQAAELLGINRNTLRKKIKSLGINVK
ncbi:MAG: Fis family transcriptional regulator [Nitrospinae bacterium]|nr:Fis family transcriptional regulator [Nitrospinota bacterium]